MGKQIFEVSFENATPKRTVRNEFSFISTLAFRSPALCYALRLTLRVSISILTFPHSFYAHTNNERFLFLCAFVVADSPHIAKRSHTANGLFTFFIYQQIFEVVTKPVLAPLAITQQTRFAFILRFFPPLFSCISWPVLCAMPSFVVIVYYVQSPENVSKKNIVLLPLFILNCKACEQQFARKINTCLLLIFVFVPLWGIMSSSLIIF